MHNRILATLALVMSLVLLAVSVDSAKAGVKSPADPTVLRQYDDLERYISGLAKTVSPLGQRISLLAMLEISEALFRWGQPSPPQM